MYYTLLKETFPVARREHKCIWCGQKILVGEKHRHERSVYDGIQDHRWHLECNEVAKDYFRTEEEFVPHENERPDAVPAQVESEGSSPNNRVERLPTREGGSI